MSERKAKRKVLVYLVLTIVSIVLVYTLTSKEYTFQLSEKQIQEKLNSIFPIEKKHLFFIRVNLSNPKIILQERSNRIHFSIDTSTNISTSNIQLKGKSKISGKLSYVSEEGAFYFKDPQVHELIIEKLPEQYNNKVEEVVNLTVKEFLDNFPLYKLKATDVKQNLAKLILKDVMVENGSLKIVLSPYK